MRHLLLTTALLAFAHSAAANWNDSQPISAIYAQDGSANIIFQQSNYSGTGCSQTNGKFFLLSASHQNYKSIYALLLSAYHAGTPVNLYLKNGVCTADGYSEISLAIVGTLH